MKRGRDASGLRCDLIDGRPVDPDYLVTTGLILDKIQKPLTPQVR